MSWLQVFKLCLHAYARARFRAMAGTTQFSEPRLVIPAARIDPADRGDLAG